MENIEDTFENWLLKNDFEGSGKKGWSKSNEEGRIVEIVSTKKSSPKRIRKGGNSNNFYSVQLIEKDDRHLVWNHSTNPYLGL